MDCLVGRHLTLDGIAKANEFLVPVALHRAPDDLALEDIESRKQGGGAVLLVVVGHGGAAPFLHRQAGLGTVEGLDLTLLVEAEHDSVGRRIDVEPDHLLELVGEFGIVGNLEGAHPMRLQSMPPFQIRRTEEGLIPAAWAIVGAGQCVASWGGA